MSGLLQYSPVLFNTMQKGFAIVPWEVAAKIQNACLLNKAEDYIELLMKRSISHLLELEFPWI
jgi:hypothetical protein